MIKKLKKIPKFFKEVHEELKKVHWSSRRELISAVILVVVMSTFLTIYIASIDLGFSKLVQFLLK
ncbi:MAG: preprotein translocase subunit SecE [Candidatus Omnitrophica bacterium]|nr:preprotein translocase subunit SecE [Candidatus Omnitrophota bacterium]